MPVSDSVSTSTRLGRWKPFQSIRDSLPACWFLAAVQLDDQLLLDRQLDVLARRQANDVAGDVLGVQVEPVRHAAAARRLDARADEGVLAAGLLDRHDPAGLDLVGRDGDLASVDEHVAVANELPRLGAGGGEAEAVGDVVQAPLEHHQQVLAGDAAAPVGLLEVGAELRLEHAVDALDLLLLPQLQALAEPAAAAARAVLAGREVAALDRALLLEAAVALQEQLHPFAPAEPADGSGVSCHCGSP